MNLHSVIIITEILILVLFQSEMSRPGPWTITFPGLSSRDKLCYYLWNKFADTYFTGVCGVGFHLRNRVTSLIQIQNHRVQRDIGLMQAMMNNTQEGFSYLKDLVVKDSRKGFQLCGVLKMYCGSRFRYG